ncbi:MAG: MATE family efflux transporter [Bacteroidetes bacterium]|uniref:Multidrug export protein MepA n=1 Tax=Candidatus Merdivivens pullistercoris TaxID=2840873 RepID=A0A9D9N8S1_9BACT|nr:MATE family efflux transporter [Candidatus Merdivivens pullistercoris]
MKNRDNFERITATPVPRLIIGLAVPTIISMLVTALYNVADTYFVGRLDTQSTAAIGISFSAMSVIQAFGFFFGHGSGNYISRMLGAKEHGNAEIMASVGLFSSFMAGLAIAVTGICFLTPICHALGSTHTILPYARDYLGIILIGTPFMAASLTLNNQIRFKGNAKYAMFGITSGAVLNVILDPILIFGFDLGVKGAAIATVISQITGFFILLAIDRRTGTFSVSFKGFRPTAKLYAEIVKGGLPSLLRQGLMSVSTILLNVAAKDYGDSAIAGMAITTRVIYILNAIVIGLGQGYQPVCGFNYGAKLYGRVRQGFWFCVKTGTLFFLISSIAGYIMAPEVVAMFRRGDPSVIQVGSDALRWQLMALPLGAFTLISNMMLQTIRKAGKAAFLASARQGLFFIPCILILPHFIGMTGVEISQAIADTLSFTVALPLTLVTLREMKRVQDNGQDIHMNDKG